MTGGHQLVRYRCRLCNEMCINRRDSDPAQAGECRHCASIIALEDVEEPPGGREERRAAPAARSGRNAGPLTWGPDPEARPSEGRRPRPEAENGSGGKPQRRLSVRSSSSGTAVQTDLNFWSSLSEE